MSVGTGSNTKHLTVFVRLLGEGTPVFRPTNAVLLRPLASGLNSEHWMAPTRTSPPSWTPQTGISLPAEPTMSQPILAWIERWYQSQCNGDWEHCFGVHINTLDNPGWDVSIGVSETALEGLEIAYTLDERSESDWFGISVKKNQYGASGDPSKLTFLLERFRELVENQEQGTLTDYLERTYPGRWKLEVCR
jgi:hypothetical protein